jgi:membrane protein implicated in regulation of membrane protease activity
MNGRIYNWRMSTNPFVQVLWLIALGVVLIGAVLIGAVLVAFALGLALIASVVFYIRVWWLRRRFMRACERGRNLPARHRRCVARRTARLAHDRSRVHHRR